MIGRAPYANGQALGPCAVDASWHRCFLAGATNPMECFATMQRPTGGRVGPVPILIGTYTSESPMENDLGRLGAYAKGYDGTEYVVFASISDASAQARPK